MRWFLGAVVTTLCGVCSIWGIGRTLKLCFLGLLALLLVAGVLAGTKASALVQQRGRELAAETWRLKLLTQAAAYNPLTKEATADDDTVAHR